MTNHWLTNRDSLLLKRCHRISKMWGPHKSCAKLELYCIIIKWWCNTILRTEPIVTAISNVSSWFHQFLGEIWDGCADVGGSNCPVQGSLIRTGWISCILLWSLSHCRPSDDQSNETSKGKKKKKKGKSRALRVFARWNNDSICVQDFVQAFKHHISHSLGAKDEISAGSSGCLSQNCWIHI